MSKVIEAQEKWRVTESWLQAKIEDTDARITALEGELVSLRNRRESLTKTLWEFQFDLGVGDVIRVGKVLHVVEELEARGSSRVSLRAEIRKVLKNGKLSTNAGTIWFNDKSEIRRVLAAKDVNQYTLKRELMKIEGEK